MTRQVGERFDIDGSEHIAGDPQCCDTRRCVCGGIIHWQPVYGGIANVCDQCGGDEAAPELEPIPKPLAPKQGPPPATPLDLDALQALCDAATPGPWRCHRFTADSPCDRILASEDLADEVIGAHYGEALRIDPKDAAFIIAAREALPRLIGRVRELEAEAARREDEDNDRYLEAKEER